MTIETFEGKGGISAKTVADTIPLKHKIRLTTVQLKYPRFIHPELMTHRMFSRNASSSRAIPVKKGIQRVKEEPYVPIFFGQNQKGMQSKEEVDNKEEAERLWLESADSACRFAESLGENVHKEIVNRVIEPYSYIHVLVTSTEWDNFFKLRLHEDAQREIQEIARCIKGVMDISEPDLKKVHTPYITQDEKYDLSLEDRCMVSAARCARVSYTNHDQSEPVTEKDLNLANMLWESGHMSPFEHIGLLMDDIKYDGYRNMPKGVTHTDFKWWWSANFRGWIQYRQLLDG